MKYFKSALTTILLSLTLLQAEIERLQNLEKLVQKELGWINYPSACWRPIEQDILDVAIIGSGMSGLSISFALMKAGITNIQLFDQSSAGLEGPWMTYARMKTLRTSKNYVGPSLGLPNLTFHAWYEALHGEDAWKKLRNPPVKDWMEYLIWYRKVLDLPVENECRCLSLVPHGNFFELKLSNPEGIKLVYARKVVLATGRKGFGGLEIPEVLKKLPKEYYAHTGEMYDFSQLQGKKVAVIGSGASAFDAAAVSLENLAAKVDLLLRKPKIPAVNKFAEFGHPGIAIGFYGLPDEVRIKFMAYAMENGIPPPKDALVRVQKHPNFRVIPNSVLDSLKLNDNQIAIQTGIGEQNYDFIVLGTGFSVDGRKVLELKNFFDEILLWKDKFPEAKGKIGNFPYLGGNFQFLEKTPGNAPYLRNLYCFNYGAALSHGMISSDIPCISVGAERLATGIAADFFVEENETFFQQLLDYDFKTFNPDEFPFLN